MASKRTEALLVFRVPTGFTGKARAVVTDVDGTLMDSQHRLPAAHLAALRSLMRRNVPVVLATGKHRGPWTQRLIQEVVDHDIQVASPWTLNAPGVFVQGLRVCDASGEVVAARTLAPELLRRCARLAEREAWTLLSYTDADTIASNRPDPETAKIDALGEPPVEVASCEGAKVHKLLFLGRPADEQAIRKAVEAEVGEEASITVAIAGMVEVLPKNSSKADGVRQALEILGIQPREVLALGDGENDVEMMEFIRGAGGLTAAVANARPQLRRAAEFEVPSCDEDSSSLERTGGRMPWSDGLLDRAGCDTRACCHHWHNVPDLILACIGMQELCDDSSLLQLPKPPGGLAAARGRAGAFGVPWARIAWQVRPDILLAVPGLLLALVLLLALERARPRFRAASSALVAAGSLVAANGLVAQNPELAVLDLFFARCLALGFLGLAFLKLPDRPNVVPGSAVEAAQILAVSFFFSAGTLLQVMAMHFSPGSTVLLAASAQFCACAVLKGLLQGLEWDETWAALLLAVVVLVTLTGCQGSWQWGCGLGLLSAVATGTACLVQRHLSGKMHHLVLLTYSGAMGLLMISPAVTAFPDGSTLAALDVGQLLRVAVFGLLHFSFALNCLRAANGAMGLKAESSYVLVSLLSLGFQFPVDLFVFRMDVLLPMSPYLAAVAACLVFAYLTSYKCIIRAEECLSLARSLHLEPQNFS
ncbi:unnamed protein product [Effrenium voratum]|nr:unnamed protein product [Effrenium voratum]